MPSTVDAGATGLQRLVVAGDQAAGELLLGRADRASLVVVELHREVRDAAGGDVGGDVDLAAAHDAHRDDRVAGRGVEAGVDRRAAGLLEGLHQPGQRLLVVDPAEELPDRPEVLDVVDQRGAGQRHQQRVGAAGPDPLGELEHVLGALRLLVLDEVRLVHDHAAEAEVAEPADVAVEHLVVDDDDVGEAVDGVAVTVDHGGRVPRRPQLGLAGPVGLDDVGDDHQQRVGVGGLGGEQGLGGLAEAGLVGEQEGAVAGLGGGDQLRLVPHQLHAVRGLEAGRLGQRHARRGTAVLERAEQRTEQLPGGQPARAGRARLGAGEVGDQERVGELAGDDRLRHHLALGGGVRGDRLGGFLLLGHLLAGAGQHLALELAGGVGDGGVLGEQLQQGRVHRGGLGEDRGDPVEALELLTALALGGLLVGLDPGALLADEQRDDLELGARGRLQRPALHRRLDLAHGAGEDGDDPLVVEVAHPSPVARRVACVARLTLAPSGQELLLCGPRRAGRGGVAVRSRPGPVRRRDAGHEGSDALCPTDAPPTARTEPRAGPGCRLQPDARRALLRGRC